MVNAKERDGKEVEEALPVVEGKCGRIVAEVDEEIEEEEEADTGSGMGVDITFLWLSPSGVCCLSRRVRSLEKVPVVILGKGLRSEERDLKLRLVDLAMR